MTDFKPIDTPIAIDKKLNEEEKGPIVKPTFYKQLVGILMYLIATRLDIKYVVNVTNIFMESPKNHTEK